MTRAVTAGELTTLRSDGQFSRLALAIFQPETVFAARVNGTPSTNDLVDTVPYTSVTSGSFVNIYNGQTLLIGSTPGGSDIGAVRAISASGSAVQIGTTSEIAWANGQYITALNEYGLWPKQSIFAGGIFLCDNNTAYTNQHDPASLRPVPVLGPDQVLYLSGSSVSCTFDASPSWVLSGSVVSYAWSAPTGTVSTPSITSPTSASTNVTFSAAGTYTLFCTVTTSGSAVATGKRQVYVYSDASPIVTQMVVNTCQGDWQSGGWTLDVTCYGQVDLSTIRDRCKVALITQDYTTSGSAVNLGPLAGYEHIIMEGWLAGETTQWNPELSTVKFEVQGPAHWLDKLASWPAGIRDVTTTPAEWNEYQGLTYDAFAWHIITWRSTISEVMDVYRSNDTHRMVGATAGWGTVWSQLSQVGDAKLFIHPAANRYGQLYLQRDTQMLTTAQRASVVTVMDISKTDWRETMDIERRILPEVAFYDTSGMSWDGSNAGGARAGAYGQAVGRFGRMERRTEIIINAVSGSAADQSELNALAGILLGQANNDYPNLTIPLAANNRFFDIAPNQYTTLTIATTDTPRGFALAAKKIVIRSLTYAWDTATGAPQYEISAEGQNTPTGAYALPFYTGELPVTSNTVWTPPVIGYSVPQINFPCSLGLTPNGPYDLGVSATVQGVPET